MPGATDKAGDTPPHEPKLGRAERDIVALGIAVAAILLFVGTGGMVLPQVVKSWMGVGAAPDPILFNALLLNIALVIFGWRRYAELTTEPGAWVSLSRLRPRFADVSQRELDTALERLLDAPDVEIEPEDNQKTLSVGERKAAVLIGGEQRHLLSIGLR